MKKKTRLSRELNWTLEKKMIKLHVLLQLNKIRRVFILIIVVNITQIRFVRGKFFW